MGKRAAVWSTPLLAAAGFAVAGFAFDMVMPLGVAAAVVYVGSVLLVSLARDERLLYWIAIGCTALTFAGLVLSPSGGEWTKVLINRGLAVFVIWVTTVLLVVWFRGAAQLQATQTRMAEMARAALDAIVVIDQQGVVLEWNSQAAELFGYPATEAIGQPVAELIIPAEQREAHQQGLARYAQTGEGPVLNQRLELVALRRDGEPFDIELTIVPLTSSRGDEFAGFVRDISERKRHQDELRQINESLERTVQQRTAELQRSNEELDQFAYAASHDLRAPMRGISSLATWIEEDAGEALPEESREHLKLLQVRVERMQRLLDDLLDFSRAGRVHGAMEEVDVAKMIREIVNLQGIEEPFAVKAGGDLPTFITLSTPLELVFRNLISNAVKHHDRPDGCVEVTCREMSDEYQFTVQDDGPGIEPKFHQRVFEIFRTLKPQDEVEGSGIGLAMIRRVMDRYGGTIRLESTPGKGAAFIFTWPKTIDVQDDSRPAKTNAGE